MKVASFFFVLTDPNFTGINKWTETELSMVAISDFGLTLLKYVEDLKNNEKQVYVNKDILPLNESQVIKYLSFMKNIYELDKSICEEKTCKESFYGQEIRFLLNDQKQVSEIEFGRNDLKVNIQVVKFEPL